MEGLEVGVLSDTHLSGVSPELQELAETYFLDCPVILHAGDLVEPEVLEVFRGKEVYAVSGNMDSPRVRASYPPKMVLEIAGYRLGLVHGWGGRGDLEERILSLFSEGIDIIIYGHSHVPVFHRRQGIYLFNPGSFSPLARRPSFGLLRLGEGIDGRIIYFPFESWR